MSCLIQKILLDNEMSHGYLNNLSKNESLHYFCESLVLKRPNTFKPTTRPRVESPGGTSPPGSHR